MPNVPSYFAYRERNGDKSGLQPFSYHDEEAAFKIGTVTIEALQFDPYTFSPHDLGLDYEGIAVSDMQCYPGLLHGMGYIYAGPKFHDFLKSNPKEVSETYKVMAGVLKLFIPDLPEDLMARGKSHFGLDSGLDSYGDLGLRVIGDCACLGASPHILFMRSKYEEGFAGYDLHNADSQAQRTSLYAGFGHIARLAAETLSL